MDSASDLDRISDLPDNLLHHILAFVHQATAVTRTAALSRRWRRQWIHAQRLALYDTTVRRGPGGFAGFVDWVLAQRGYADMESLDISMRRVDGCCASTEHVNAWLRYAMRYVVKSFSLSLTMGGCRRVVLLPGHGRMESVSLSLLEHVDIFRLPVAAAARYEALKELRLYGPSFDEVAAPGGGRTLGDFVSSCCPRLRKLHICAPTGMPQLVIRSDALEELSILLAEDLRVLDVTAPSMRVLKLQVCFKDPPTPLEDSEEQETNNLVRIAAPRLEEIGMSTLTHGKRPQLDIHDTARASVRRLSDIRLDMHGRYCSDRSGGLWLLENCPGVEHINVSIDHGHGYASTSRAVVDLTVEGAAPFASVRSMVVKAHTFSQPHMVSSISSLLSRCPQLRSLTIDITETERSYAWMCFCNDVDKWKFHRKFSLGSLEEVTIRGFLGADEDMELLTLLFEGSNSIRSLTLRAITRFPDHVTLERMMAEDGEKDTESIIQKLMNIPCTDRGYWHFGKDATWTSYPTEK